MEKTPYEDNDFVLEPLVFKNREEESTVKKSAVRRRRPPRRRIRWGRVWVLLIIFFIFILGVLWGFKQGIKTEIPKKENSSEVIGKNSNQVKEDVTSAKKMPVAEKTQEEVKPVKTLEKQEGEKKQTENQDKEFLEVTVGKEGNSLWDIAQKYCGNGALYKEIANYNNLGDGRTVKNGQKIKIPKKLIKN